MTFESLRLKSRYLENEGLTLDDPRSSAKFSAGNERLTYDDSCEDWFLIEVWYTYEPATT